MTWIDNHIQNFLWDAIINHALNGDVHWLFPSNYIPHKTMDLNIDEHSLNYVSKMGYSCGCSSGNDINRSITTKPVSPHATDGLTSATMALVVFYGLRTGPRTEMLTMPPVKSDIANASVVVNNQTEYDEWISRIITDNNTTGSIVIWLPLASYFVLCKIMLHAAVSNIQCVS